METQDVDAGQLVPYDENLLEAARTQWQFGDWRRLAQLSQHDLQHHPQRAKLALLCAAGHFQAGELNEAHRQLRLAQDWGCSRRLITQMLVAGIHQNLAGTAFLLARERSAAGHLELAVALGGVPGDLPLLTRVRRQNLMTPDIFDAPL